MLKVTRATDPVLAGLVDEELRRQELPKVRRRWPSWS